MYVRPAAAQQVVARIIPECLADKSGVCRSYLFGILILMKAVVLYHPASEHSRAVEEFAHNIKAQTGIELDLLSVDTVEGSRKAEVYDITQYPAVLVTKDDGSMQKMWQGETLPLINEVVSYLIA